MSALPQRWLILSKPTPASCCCRLLRGVQRLQPQLQLQLPALSGLSCTSVQPNITDDSFSLMLPNLFSCFAAHSSGPPSALCCSESWDYLRRQTRLWINVEASDCCKSVRSANLVVPIGSGGWKTWTSEIVSKQCSPWCKTLCQLGDIVNLFRLPGAGHLLDRPQHAPPHQQVCSNGSRAR